MRRCTMAVTIIGILSASSALAQVEISQQGDTWYSDAQARIEELAAVSNNTNRAKNVILFVADGNGVGSNYATRLWVGQQAGGLGDDHVLPQEAFPNLALVKTYTTNGQTPDSAPTASALNTGVKSRNGTINVGDAGAYDSCDAAGIAGLTTFAEIVSDMGKSAGFVTTARITRHPGRRLCPNREPRLGGRHATADPGLRAEGHCRAAGRCDRGRLDRFRHGRGAAALPAERDQGRRG